MTSPDAQKYYTNMTLMSDDMDSMTPRELSYGLQGKFIERVVNSQGST